MNGLHLFAFSGRARALAERIAQAFQGTVHPKQGYQEAVGRVFQTGNTLVFVGASGIAVRAIAPWIQDKAKDPAVLVVDETGRYVISLLSGHLGGANEAARTLADFLGAQPVITTATDLHGVFAVDSWARSQGLLVANKEAILPISKALLEGQSVGYLSADPIEGRSPAGVVDLATSETAMTAARFYVDPSGALAQDEGALRLYSKTYWVGAGCRRGTEPLAFQRFMEEVLQGAGIPLAAVEGLTSIDLKKEEAAFLDRAKALGIPFRTYTAQELAAVPGAYRESEWVLKTTGVGNVCERAARLASLEGPLVLEKVAHSGMTLAVARREGEISF
ncbi:Cobalt-precorrin 5A hydrolase [Clostridiaceae bacterium JG1575]|nr:Cobalt-precorrin 5A hydrolase [Clostridiaceae bacterium JG1575]